MEDHKMKLILKDKDRKVKVEFHRDSDVFDVMTEVRGALIAWGFHPDSVVEGCNYISEEYGKDLDEAE